MPADNEPTMTMDQFRNSPEGNTPAPASEETTTPPAAGATDTPAEAPSTAKQDTPPAGEGDSQQPTEGDKTPESDALSQLRAQEQGLATEEDKLLADIAARKERITQARAARRALVAAEKEEPTVEKPNIDPTLANYDQGDVEMIANTAAAKGFAKRDDVDQLVDMEFMRTNPEYSLESDPTGEKLDALKAYAAREYTPATDYRDRLRKLAKAKRDIRLDNAPPENRHNPAKLAAQKQQLKTAGQGSGGSSAGAGGTPTAPAVNQDRYNRFFAGYKQAGYSDKEAKAMAQKAAAK